MSPEIAPALFPTGESLLGYTKESQSLQHSLASAISPALLLSWQSPRHSSPRMLKQALMIQDFFLLALPTSLFFPIPTYPLLSAQRSYLTTCGNKSQGRQHFEHSSLSPPAFLTNQVWRQELQLSLPLCIKSLPGGGTEKNRHQWSGETVFTRKRVERTCLCTVCLSTG